MIEAIQKHTGEAIVPGVIWAGIGYLGSHVINLITHSEYLPIQNVALFTGLFAISLKVMDIFFKAKDENVQSDNGLRDMAVIVAGYAISFVLTNYLFRFPLGAKDAVFSGILTAVTSIAFTAIGAGVYNSSKSRLDDNYTGTFNDCFNGFIKIMAPFEWELGTSH